MRLGQALIEANLLTPQQVKKALYWQQADPSLRLGDICLQQGWLQSSQIIRTVITHQHLPKAKMLMANHKAINAQSYADWLLPNGIYHRLIDLVHPMKKAVAHKALCLLKRPASSGPRFLHQARKHNPSCLLLWQIWTFEQLGKNDFLSVNQAFLNLTSSQRQHTEVQFLYALALMSQGNMAAAKCRFLYILQKQPVYIEDILFCLALCCRQLKHHRDANDYFLRFLSITSRQRHQSKKVAYARQKIQE